MAPSNTLQQLKPQDIKRNVIEAKISVFEDFCSKRISPAQAELSKISENNRKHLQKLVYTHLVNKFDSLVDELLLWSSVNNEKFREEIIGKLDSNPLTKKDIYSLFLLPTDQLTDTIHDELQTVTRLKFLNQRHSKKLETLLSSFDWKNMNIPRVSNNGEILSRTTRSDNVPGTIVGHADWLYSRRNSLVHGDGINFTDPDYKHLKSAHKAKLSKNFRLQLNSITSGQKFYLSLLKKLLEFYK